MNWQDLAAHYRLSCWVVCFSICCSLAQARESWRGPQDEQAAANDVVTWVGTIRSAELAEISGITCSGHLPQAAWVHNDSGNDPVAYLISPKGQLLARCPLANTRNRDWEDICSFEYQGKKYLLIGDVGDNSAIRETCQLYLFEEPEIKLDPRGVVDHPLESVQSISYRYADGPRNCEAIAFDGASATVLVLEKATVAPEASRGAGVYAIDIRPWLDGWKSTQRLVPARRIANLPLSSVTGMAISRDGRKLVCRDYLQGYLLQRTADQAWQDCIHKSSPFAFALPVQRQGEAICFTDDGEHVLLASEFTRQPIWRVRLPKSVSDENPITEEK